MNRFLLILMLALPLCAPIRVDAIDGGVESLRQSGKAFASVAQVVSPSVVNIQIKSGSPETGMTQVPLPFGEQFPFGYEVFKRFFGDRFPGTPR